MSCSAIAHCWHEDADPTPLVLDRATGTTSKSRAEQREVCCFCGDVRRVRIFIDAVATDGHGQYRPRTGPRIAELQAEIRKLRSQLSDEKREQRLAALRAYAERRDAKRAAAQQAPRAT